MTRKNTKPTESNAPKAEELRDTDLDQVQGGAAGSVLITEYVEEIVSRGTVSTLGDGSVLIGTKLR